MREPSRPSGLGGLRPLRQAHLHRVHAPGAGGVAVPGLHRRRRQEDAGDPAVRRVEPGPRTGIVGSTNPTPVVIGLVVVCVVVFVVSGFGKASVIDRFGGLSHQVHQSDEYYRFFTSMFLHLNVLHIASNMITLLIVGPAVEVMLGRSRFLSLYLVAGLGGSVASYLFSPGNSVSAGASGAIFGVMGAYVVLAHRRRYPLAPVVALIVINLVIGFTGSIDWRDHLGGLVVGVVLALAYDYSANLRPAARRIGLTVGVTVAVLAVLAVVVAAVPPGHPYLQFG